MGGPWVTMNDRVQKIDSPNLNPREGLNTKEPKGIPNKRQEIGQTFTNQMPTPITIQKMGEREF
eukprot:6309957-Karenia_brevis.AAC.1